MRSPKTPNQINVEQMLKRMERVNAVSPSFCTAKWLQSTVYLTNGFTHSCHHPAPHPIPLEEIQKNPGALHNTSHKIEQRKLMLAGERPKECQYCWNIENLSTSHISDRIYKSTDTEWSFPFLEKILGAGPDHSIDPSYLEVAFENTCNLKCAYCSPDVSSKWMEEIREFGPYPTSRKTGDLGWLEQERKTPISRTEINPYVEAFWKWWPDLYPNLNTFRITGGEPLLSPNTWKVLEEIRKNPRSDFNLAINTNMAAPESLLQRLIDYQKAIAPNIRSFEIYTSAEASGTQCEYIRFGIHYEQFLANVRTFLRETGKSGRVNFMVTFNALSLTSFHQFLADLWQLRVEFNEPDGANRLPMMISYLRWPPFLSAQIVPSAIKQKCIERIKAFAFAHTRQTSPDKRGRFYLEELDQLERLFAFISTEPAELARDRSDFRSYVQEYDRRRGTDFAAAFPELREMTI